MHDVSLRSVATRIKGQDQLIAQVAQVWGVPLEPSREGALLKALSERMQNRFVARSIWEQLNEVEQRCLYEILNSSSRAQGVPREHIRKKVKGSEEAFEAALAELRDRWILLDEEEIPAKSSKRSSLSLELVQPPVLVRAYFPYREMSEAMYRTGRELFIPHEVRSQHTLGHLLSMMPWEQREALANLCHVPLHKNVPVFSYNTLPSISHPIEVQKRIVEALQQPLIVFDLVHRLSSVGQSLFLWLVEREGSVSQHQVQAYLTERHCGFEEQLALLQTLEAYALAFDTLLATGEREVFIHQEVLAAIGPEALERVHDEQSYAFLPVGSSPAVIREAEPMVLYDLATIIGWTYQQMIEQTKEEKIPKRWATKIRPMLQGLPRKDEGQDDQYPDQLFRAAKSLQLLRCDTRDTLEKPRYRPGPKLAEFGKLSALGQLRLILEWWVQSDCWYDVHPDGKRISPGASSASKKRLLESVKQCMPGQWYRVQALLFSIWKQTPLYLYDPYRRQPEHLSVRERRARWMELEGRLYVGFLFSALQEFGLVSLGYDHDPAQGSDPDLFKLTPIGAILLKDIPNVPFQAESLQAQTTLIIQPSFEVLLLSFDPDLVYRLVQFAQIKLIGRVSTFTLCQPAFLRGLEAGNRVEQVLAFLSGYSQKELPQNIVFSLKDWRRAYKEARLEEVVLIELSSEQTEGDLYRALEGQIVEPRKLAPGIFVVTIGKNTFFDLRRLLEKAGIVVSGESTSKTQRR